MTNNLTRRAQEHINSRSMKIREVMGGLTREQARGVEQVLIEAQGLKRNGGDLVNRINSISPNAENYERLKSEGLRLLREAGISTKPNQ